MFDLKKFLNMSEDEQLQWLIKHEITRGTFAMSDVTKKAVPHWIKIEFAVLAFRLRDKAVNCAESDWNSAKRNVAKEWVDEYINLVNRVCNMDLVDEYVALTNTFFVNEAKPIHWIAAALEAMNRPKRP